MFSRIKIFGVLVTVFFAIFFFGGCQDSETKGVDGDEESSTSKLIQTNDEESSVESTVESVVESVVESAVETGNKPIKWSNSLKPDGPEDPPLTLVKNGESNYIIVISQSADEPDVSAAQELQSWIRQMTDVYLPIKTESEIPNGTSGIISVGRTKLLDEAFPDMATKKLKNGGWGIAGNETDLFLWGDEGRGTINAVFAFLEEDLGFRWYTKDDIWIPESSTLEVSPIRRIHSPVLRVRDPFYSSAFSWKWSVYNRTEAHHARVPEAYGGHVNYGGESRFGDYGNMFCHTFNDFIPPEKYFDEYPEYFMLEENGRRSELQLCMTNPDVIDLMIENVHIFLEESPNTDIVSVSKNDYVKVCSCETCKSLDEAEGSNMASLLYLVNSVAESIKDEYPDVYVSTLAYLETIEPPKTIRPAENVIIRLTNDSAGSWVYPFTPAEYVKFGSLVETWSEEHNNIYIWDYIINFDHYMVPMPNMHMISRNIKFYVKNNVQGIMMQGSMQGPGAEREFMRSWVISKLMLYPSINVNDLMDDFIYGYFREAAEPIAQYNKLLKEQGENFRILLQSPPGGIRYRVDHQFLSKEFIDESTRLFDKAEKLAESEEILRRVERERLSIMYVQLARGPNFTGDEYPNILRRFTNIALRIRVTNLSEGPSDLMAKILNWQQEWEEFKVSNREEFKGSIR